MQEIAKPKLRYFSLDVIRIVAILSVVGLHATSPLVNLENVYSPDFLIGLILNAPTHIGVPLFIMVSGALVLGRDKTLKTSLERTAKLIVLLFIWNLFYAVVETIFKEIILGREISIANFIKVLTLGYNHLWFLYMLICIYLFTPMLNLLTKPKNKQIFLYMIFMTIVLGVIVPYTFMAINAIFTGANPEASTFSKVSGWSDCVYIAYYLLGWYLWNTDIPKKYEHIIYALGIAGLVALILGVYFPSLAWGTPHHHAAFENASPGKFLLGMAVFVFIKAHIEPTKESSEKAILISNLVFGVYILHMVFMEITKKLIHTQCLVLDTIIVFVATIILSFALSYALSKMPVLKKLIRV